ncbi:MAG: hypothetical protein ACRDT2_11075 [Natronosporangium sp.]
MIDLQVTVSGPLFDGRAHAAVDAFLDDAEQQVADVGFNDVRAELGRVLRNPTGFYESRIQTERQRDDVMVTDGGVVYGPWLEGTSQRNQSSRFKGYATFRRVAQRLQDKAGSIAEQLLPRYVDRMNR